ncbi:MAG: FAD-linked oxidase C-terminal domain-containing protein [Candidatus Thiodiazotropha endolucinida]
MAILGGRLQIIGLSDVLRVMLDILPPAALILTVLGSIFAGIATVTEASDIGALGATILSAMYRRLDFTVFKEVVINTMNTSAYIFAIFVGATIFGHALEGNLHFVITPDFGEVKEIERYHDFMDDLCHMVVEKYDGSLKAEHSTGRNIAPYVELEWGAEAYALMHRIKRSLDPHGLLNPGVILNQDKEVHVKHLKSMAAVDPLVDRCIECGFYEPICPSRELTLTPRQRIVVLREQAHRKSLGETEISLEPLENFDYAVEERRKSVWRSGLKDI